VGSTGAHWAQSAVEFTERKPKLGEHADVNTEFDPTRLALDGDLKALRQGLPFEQRGHASTLPGSTDSPAGR